MPAPVSTALFALAAVLTSVSAWAGSAVAVVAMIHEAAYSLLAARDA